MHGPSFYPLNFIATARLQSTLSQNVSNKLFSLLFFAQEEMGNSINGMIIGKPRTKYIIDCTADEVVREKWPAEDNLMSCEVKLDLKYRFCEDFIVFLGTGSALPSKYRNVSSFLVGFPSKNAFYLFDCGEGTIGQIYRKFGTFAIQILRNITAIFITHLHADHHMGTLSFLLKEHACTKRVHIYGPDCLKQWFLISTACDGTLNGNDNFIYISLQQEPLPILDIRSIPVDHCEQSYGYVVTFITQNGLKFSLA